MLIGCYGQPVWQAMARTPPWLLTRELPNTSGIVIGQCLERALTRISGQGEAVADAMESSAAKPALTQSGVPPRQYHP